jgi:putative sugar O-methyltransferase
VILLDELVRDEKKNNRDLYSSGPYWDYKNKRAILEIKRTGLKNFRGINSSIGSSFSDNLTLDIRNEFNAIGRIIGKIFSLPILKKIFDTQLIITRRYLKEYLKNQSIVYQNNTDVKNLLEKYKFFNDTDFGCAQTFEYLGKKYSCHYMTMADRIKNLSEFFNFDKIISYFEIGGGFGANVHFLINNFPNIKKVVYLDVVPNLYVGTNYLKHHFSNCVKDYIELKNLNKISFSKDKKLEILCIPPWLIEKLDVEIDHFHNAASFVEMPTKVIKNYVKYIKKFNTKEISLISYERTNLKTTFDPEKLNCFFENKLNIFWKKNLIHDYKKKSIYLISKK